MNPGQYIFSKFKLWLPSQKDPWTVFLRQPLITPFPTRISLLSDAGAEEAGSLSTPRWQPTSRSD